MRFRRRRRVKRSLASMLEYQLDGGIQGGEAKVETTSLFMRVTPRKDSSFTMARYDTGTLTRS